MDVRNRLRRWFEEIGREAEQGVEMQPDSCIAVTARHEREDADESDGWSVTEHPFATFDLPEPMR